MTKYASAVNTLQATIGKSLVTTFTLTARCPEVRLKIGQAYVRFGLRCPRREEFLMCCSWTTRAAYHGIKRLQCSFLKGSFSLAFAWSLWVKGLIRLANRRMF
jgi:hypothetical protein